MKFRNIKWLLAAILGLFGVLLALVVYTNSQAAGATSKYITVKENVDTLSVEVRAQTIERKVAEKVMVQKIAELQSELVSQRQEQRALLERILALQVEFAKEIRSVNRP
jgi:hypothetical protein